MTKNRIATLLAATALSGAVMAAPAQAGKLEDLQAQIQLMQEQMAALQQAIMDAKAEAAAANEKSKADTAAAVAAVAAVKEDVKKTETKVADAAKKASSSGSSVKVSGRMFANASTVSVKKDGVKQDSSSGAGLDVKRFYVGVDGKLNDTWSANVTTDFQYDSGAGVTQVYLKKAYVQGKFSDAFTVRVGEADLPWVPFAEGLYGFRYVENTVADRTKFGTSAAWGVHAFGKLGGIANYAVAVVNNANSYKNPGRSNSMDIEARLGITPVKDLTFGAGVTSGKLGKNVVSDTPASENLTATRFNAIAAYTGHGANVGVEYFHAKNWNRAATNTTDDKAEGFSIFAAYQIDKVKPFVRYDEVKTKKLSDPTLKDKYYNAGIAFNVTKGLDVAAVFKHTDVGNASTDTKTNEFGVWTQVSF